MDVRIDECVLKDPGAAVKLAARRTPAFSYQWEPLDAGPPGQDGQAAAWRMRDGDVELRIARRIGREAHGALCRMRVTNAGAADVLLAWIAPLWCGKPFDGFVDWPGLDPSALRMISQPLWMGGGGVIELASVKRLTDQWQAGSFWAGVIGASSREPALTAGIGDWANAQVQVKASVHNGRLHVAVIGGLGVNRSDDPLLLPAGASFDLQPVLVAWGRDSRESTARYAAALARQSGIRPSKPPHGGVFSGYGMGARYPRPERVGDERFILTMLEAVAGRDRGGHGVVYFKTQFSRFSTGPAGPVLPGSRFGAAGVWPDGDPDGLVEEILAHGFVRSTYDLADRAPSGVRAITDAIRKRGYRPAFDSRPFLNFDATHRENDGRAAALYAGIVKRWGYDYLMFDFLSTDFESRDNRRTMSQAIRDRLAAIREAVGPEVFLEACMSVLGPVIGIADGFRPAEDWRPGSERALAVEFANRYFFHNAVIQHDMEYLDASARPSCWDMWHNRSMHSLERVRLMVDLSAITGFSTLIGGFLDETSEERWRIFSRCLPVAGGCGRPWDYPESDPPQIWVQELSGPVPCAVGVFNWDESSSRSVRVPVAEILGLAADCPVAAWDFWARRLSIVRDGWLAVVLEPAGSAVLDLQPLGGDGAPQYVGSDRHLLANAGVVGVESDEAGVKGVVEIIGDERVSLFFRLPPGWAPDFDAAAGCAPELVRQDLLRVDVAGPHGARIGWEVPRADGYFVF